MRNKVFFELLQVALGARETLSVSLTAAEWGEMLACAQRQALVGVCFTGVEKLPIGQRPPREVVLQWYALTKQIEERNKMLNVRSVEACRYFEKHGFLACVLKGQGNARLYGSPFPTSLREEENVENLWLRRQSGDIDVWLMPNVMDNGEWKMENGAARGRVDLVKARLEVLRWVRKRYPEEEFDLKHVHFPILQDVAMEVHFVPSLLRSPIANRRLRRFYEREAAEQMQHSVALEGVDAKLGGLNCPTTEFNIVYQLTHIFDHFISEGVGLRQVVDYYFLLRSLTPDPSPKGEGKTIDEFTYVIRSIGLMGFAQGLMWVLHEVLGMEEEMMLCPMDERRGRVLLDEILAGGNFGHYESRYWYDGMSKWKFYVARLRRMAHFLRYYPSEVLWDIPFRIRQRVWMVARQAEKKFNV